MGIFNFYVETTEAGLGPVLLDPMRGDTMSHCDATPSRHTKPLTSVALILVALSSATGCATSTFAPRVESLAVNAPQAQTHPVMVASSPIASPSPDARMLTVDTRSAVAAWRSPMAHVDSEILANTARCPVEMALVDGRVCVDRWEGTLVERFSGGVERAWSPYQPVDGMESRMRAVSRPGVIPQGYISGEQAARACTASGKRLCSGEEWESACRGSRRTQFPYGDQRKSRVCNDDVRSKHPVVEVGMMLNIPENRLWYDGMNQPLINQLPNSLFETGVRAECTNDYGVFDMVGNLHEWINDPSGTFRGGYYMDTTLNGDGCSYATTAHGFAYHDYSTGFRCCADPDHVE